MAGLTQTHRARGAACCAAIGCLGAWWKLGAAKATGGAQASRGRGWCLVGVVSALLQRRPERAIRLQGVAGSG